MNLNQIAKGVKVYTDLEGFGFGTITGDHRWPNLGDSFSVKFDGMPYSKHIALEAVGRFTIVGGNAEGMDERTSADLS